MHIDISVKNPSNLQEFVVLIPLDVDGEEARKALSGYSMKVTTPPGIPVAPIKAFYNTPTGELYCVVTFIGVFNEGSADKILSFVVDNLPDMGVIDEGEGKTTEASFLYADIKSYIKELVLPSGKVFLDNITNLPESKAALERFIKSDFMYKKLRRYCKHHKADLSGDDGTMLSLPLFTKDNSTGKVVISSNTGMLLSHYTAAIMMEEAMPQVAKAIVVNGNFAEVFMKMIATPEEEQKTTLKEELQKALKDIEANPYQKGLYNNEAFTLD